MWLPRGQQVAAGGNNFHIFNESYWKQLSLLLLTLQHYSATLSRIQNLQVKGITDDDSNTTTGQQVIILHK